MSIKHRAAVKSDTTITASKSTSTKRYTEPKKNITTSKVTDRIKTNPNSTIGVKTAKPRTKRNMTKNGTNTEMVNESQKMITDTTNNKESYEDIGTSLMKAVYEIMKYGEEHNDYKLIHNFRKCFLQDRKNMLESSTISEDIGIVEYAIPENVQHTILSYGATKFEIPHDYRKHEFCNDPKTWCSDGKVCRYRDISQLKFVIDRFNACRSLSQETQKLLRQYCEWGKTGHIDENCKHSSLIYLSELDKKYKK